NKRGVPGKVVPAPGAGPTLGQANPRSLLSRQGPLEMTPSRVQDMAEDMMVDRFNWRSSGPIVVAEGPNGVRIILDGHHRAAAAMEAGLDSVPIRIQQVPTDRWGQLIQEVFEAAEGRW
ncbi:MAG: ParB N-terminal domain-containing protein, partial [Patescibacteria group bacterium]|nr:ParB N-terminal domain-containing protein [Patescibacteria group bacterium]